MKTRHEPDPQSHQRLLATHGGSPAAAFAALAGVCLRRWLRQNGRPPLAEALLARYLARMWEIVNEAGLPRPLATNHPGQAGEMSGERVTDLVGRVYAGIGLGVHECDLETVTRQLLKTCLHPEFRGCRTSYKEVVKGVCRRQEQTRACDRISGSHCVDCPYWVTLHPDQHVVLLTNDWVGTDREELIRHRDIFLPEDFRALRIFLWQHVRCARFEGPDKAGEFSADICPL